MKNMTFEAGLTRIAEINRLMALPETGVETAVSLFREASELLAHCQTTLAEARLKIEEITVEFDNEL